MTNISGKHLKYRSIPNDPWGVREYILSNGIRLLISVNREEPRIFTNIAFRAGSKHDPPGTTGLAHYMEHMLFKGTKRIGALNWEKEEKYLDEITGLYETYRKTTDEGERKKLYLEIDKLSFDAAQLVAPNEYDRLAGALGAARTNAYTWVEQTVYVNDVPANELDRWMKLESERFRYLALRLFHTELETVYEEFNISQDQDFRKVNQALRKVLFPNHPYGTQTTLGDPAHLRNPSMKNIHDFFEKYYVPGNMAIVLSGDLDPEAAVELAELHFGDLAERPVPPFHHEKQPRIHAPIHDEVVGKEAPYLMIGWRCGATATNDPLYITMLENLLCNEQAGLMDINLNQQQKVLQSRSWSWTYEDYSVFGLFGRSREGQSLEEVETLLLEQLALARQGDFPDSLLEAVVNNQKLEDIQAGENNSSRVSAMTQMFILGVDWSRFVNRVAWMEKLRKEDLLAWINKKINPDNYAAIYKTQGEDHSAIKVDKPPITPVQLNRGAQSVFANEFLQQTPPRLKPRFADFERNIRQHELRKGLRFDYVPNRNNQLFRLDYIFDFGKSADRRLALALLYLPYLGTGSHTAQAMQEAFYRLGLSFEVFTNHRQSYITLQGLDEHLEEGIRLLEHLLHEAQPNANALQNLVSDVLTKREHAKNDRRFILHKAMMQYGLYGEDSPFHFRLNRRELLALEGEDLVGRLRALPGHEHEVYYYGPREPEAVERILLDLHRLPETLKPAPETREFQQQDTGGHRITLVDFPIVQSDMMLLSKGTPHFDLKEAGMSKLYNEYFGSGLSSIVFQEIRESKALAYSTFARYSSPSRKKDSHYLQAYVGTQPDKLQEAITSLREIIENMPIVPEQIEQARESILRRMESDSLPPRHVYWKARSAWKLGYRHDLRRDFYRQVLDSGLEELRAFHEKHVRGRSYHTLVLGQEDRLDIPYLESMGSLQKLSLEELFAY